MNDGGDEINCEQKFCILGAGSSGLAAAKNFLQAGIPFDCLEREDDVGGNWYYGKPASSVYASTHLISSKRLTEYVDFPLPAHYPEYPGRELVWEYFRDYARHFGLYERIEFNTTIERIEPREQGWRMRLAGGEVRDYRGVVIANGHNWDPRWPEYRGEFTGKTLHSREYKTPDVLQGQRVLVVGGGNSGTDLAVEAAVHARTALHSTRRRYPVLPKFFRGKPIDQCNELLQWLRLPLWVRRLGAQFVSHLVLGPAARSGVPAADHRLFETHPVINSQLHHHVTHGNLMLKPDVQELRGTKVAFTDGSEEEIDLILYATGFKASFPFIDERELNWQRDAPELFLNVFHPERDDLFCIGLIQPDSGQWGLVDYQSQLVARFLQAAGQGSGRAEWFRKLKRRELEQVNGGVRYVDSPRHRLEVEHFAYRERLKKLIRQLG